MKIYQKYKLIKDLPEAKAGTILHWDLWGERYTELSYIGIGVVPELIYKADFLKNHTEWFEPIGKEEELYVKFPDDFAEDHFYFGELRHNKMCRFCFDAQEILASKEFETKVTGVFKELYDKKLKKFEAKEEPKKQ